MATAGVTRYSMDSSRDSQDDDDGALLGHYQKRYRKGGYAGRGKRAARCRHPAVYFLSGLFAGLILVGLVLILYMKFATKRACSASLTGEVNSMVPEFPVRQVLFGRDPLATSDHTTEESKNATYNDWLSYMPVGNGFVALGQPKGNLLPPPIKYNDKDTYSVAYTHQLHCLHSIMTMYNGLLDGSMSAPTSHKHIDHCFRYLRQSIVCCGDTALEGQDPNRDVMGTDGTGAVHLCKDYDQLLSWTESKRVVDGHVI
ncbi:hypothetical protein PG997_005401 [Apiospora hydei]|uniref:Oxidase ustYa n=1 Tax=Apiospora hydei TaxID=1337664 RepID=A0ABR1X4U8_9PEZI